MEERTWKNRQTHSRTKDPQITTFPPANMMRFCVDQLQKVTSLLKDTVVVLDFAAAAEEIAPDLDPHVARVNGIDLSRKMTGLASRKALE